MTETIPIKKQTGLPPWFGAFTPNRETNHHGQIEQRAVGGLLDFSIFPEVFAEGIGRIDDGGAVTHITWYVRHLCDGKTSRVSVIVPTDMLPTIARQFPTRRGPTRSLMAFGVLTAKMPPAC